MKSYLYSFVFIFILFSCSNEDNITPQTEADIQAYIAANNLNAQKTSSGLYFIIEKQGTGTFPSRNSNVTVAYKGYLLDGNVFDESANGISIGLNQVIPGWTEGIQLFRVGGEGKLIIPYQLGYGIQGRAPAIPGGAVLVFDINLKSVN
ncbi:FKBP-type peptidyl-prolyl cis-trans isomerase [uncultured Polaribacter sp.]|uniref:FKBP-type peptidyl-prolyl cis-trans isomerase n=1 Tax=uncultured Polaribacter sp. TaxID=174711 RepID=UPI00262784B3|nr:FKBP-type peptidyl-prolyl cis-trans isomerase [uncultured Polaribacter sp.]